MAERQTTVRLLPTPKPDPGVVRRACKRPRCSNELDPPTGRSRPREFCSAGCRLRYQRERDQVRSNLLEAQRIALQYEIEGAAAMEASPKREERAEHPASSAAVPSAQASYLALSLLAQALEAITLDLADGVPLDLEEVLTRITRAKQEGDRILRTYGR